MFFQISVGVCPFPSTPAAISAAISILQEGVDVARIEFLDQLSMEACKSYSNIPYECSPTLFFEFHANSKIVMDELVQKTKEIAMAEGALSFSSARDPEERNALWKARHEVYYACKALIPNSSALSTDVCVPISRLTEMIVGAQKLLDENKLTGQLLRSKVTLPNHYFLPWFPDGHENATEHDAGTMTMYQHQTDADVSNCQWIGHYCYVPNGIPLACACVSMTVLI